jgi:hypothetical protein
MRTLTFAASLLSFAALALAGCAAPTTDADASSETSESAFTNDWKTLLTCNGGAAALDVNGNERKNLQFVIRDLGAIRYLNQVGATASPFGATEIVLSGWTGHVDWSEGLGPRLDAQPYGAPGVFSPNEFKEMIADHNTYEGGFGRFVRVAREGSGLKVQFGTIERRGCAKTETHYVGDGFGWQTSCVADYSAFVEKANWYFNDCH